MNFISESSLPKKSYLIPTQNYVYIKTPHNCNTITHLEPKIKEYNPLGKHNSSGTLPGYDRSERSGYEIKHIKMLSFSRCQC